MTSCKKFFLDHCSIIVEPSVLYMVANKGCYEYKYSHAHGATKMVKAPLKRAHTKSQLFS